MTTKPDTKTDRNRLRAATLVALTTAVIATLLLGATGTANAAHKRKTAKPLVAPTSVTLLDGVTCTDLGDGTWDVTARFEVTGGRYLNLGSDPVDGLNGPRDLVRGGGTRYVESTRHFSGFPGYADDHTVPVTHEFDYEHFVAPIVSKDTEVSLRSLRRLSRSFEVTYTCL